MPKVKVDIDHLLTQEEAICRLKDTCTWAHSFSDLKEHWSGNTVEFSTIVQGVRVSGKIEVTTTELKMNGTIPLIALPFKSWIPNILRNTLKQRKSTTITKDIVKDDPVLLYLHIPKAGGTTVGEFIYNQCQNGTDHDEGLIKNGVFFTQDGFFKKTANHSQEQFYQALQRDDLRAVMGHFSFGIHNYIKRAYKYVTVLREPVSRVISLYHYLKLENSMSFEDFAGSSIYREVENDQTRRIAGLKDDTGKCTHQHLDIAIQNLDQHFAVAGLTERMDEVLVLLQRKFNWNRSFASYPKNVNPSIKKTDTPSTVALDTILERNQLDSLLYKHVARMMDTMIAGYGPDFYRSLADQKKLNASSVA